MKKTKTLLFLLFVSAISFGQELIIVKGTIISEKENIPLPFVNISVKGTERGTTTDIDGKFTLKVTKKEVLLVSYLGYIPYEVTINNQETLTVILKEDANRLDEIVVVGYGSQKKSKIVGSVTSVKVEDLQKIPLARADQALQGQVAGVVVTNNDASPNANVSIRVRGISSIGGGNNPLIVIDGLQGANFSDIHPSDVESIEVLKDAAATAIYGSRGAAGVILITSKKGKNRKAQISYSTFSSIQFLRKKIDLMNGYQYANYVNENRAARNLAEVYTPAEVASFKTKYTDWQDQIFGVGFSTNHHLNINGYTNTVSYSLSGDFLETKGIVVGTKFNKYSFMPNISYQHNDKLKINLYSFFAFSKENPTILNQRDSEGSPIYSALLFPPTKPVYDEDGKYSQPGGGVGPNTEFNPLALAIEPIRDNFSDRITLNPNIEYAFNKNISLKITSSYRSVKDVNNLYLNEKVINGSNEDRKASILTNTWTSYQNSNILTYRKKINKHSFDFTGLFEQQKITRLVNYTGASNFITNATTYNNLSLGSSIERPYSNKEEQSLESFMGRLDYAFDDKYSISFTARYDASSVFAENNKRAFFPSVGGAWNVSEEKFLKENNTITSLKLRASYGEVGNATILPYQSLAQLNSGTNYSFNGSSISSGVKLSTRAPNPNLKWETTKQINIGLDAGLLHNKVTVVMDYYKKNTQDLLHQRALYQASGYKSQLINAGEVLNEGIEIAISGTPINKENFSWATNLTFSKNRNKVLSLFENKKEIALSGVDTDYENIGLPGFENAVWLEVGQPIGLIKGYEYAGVWKTDEATTAAIYNTTPGSPKYVDQNNDKKIDIEDVVNIANALPDFTFGWNNTLTYKNFSLNTLVIGAQGNDIYNIGRSMIEASDDGTSSNLLNVWSTSNENSNIPGHNQTGTIRNSSRWTEDGSYIRLKNITLAYKAPAKFTDKLGVTNARIYITGTNLLTLTKYTGFDPELNNSNGLDTFAGVDLATYPSQKQYSIGLELKF